MATKKDKLLVLDMDDTVTSFTRTLCHLHNKKHGTCLTENDILQWDFSTLNLIDGRGNTVTGNDLQTTYKYYEDNGLYAVLEPLEYAKYALEIARSIGYKVIILTARDVKYKIQTELNLFEHDLTVDQVIYEWDKVKAIKELSKTCDVVIFADDKFTTVKAVSENCKVKKCFLINKAHNRDFDLTDLEIVRANDLMDCVKELKKVNK